MNTNLLLDAISRHFTRPVGDDIIRADSKLGEWWARFSAMSEQDQRESVRRDLDWVRFHKGNQSLRWECDMASPEKRLAVILLQRPYLLSD